jgi:hypothetical protein
MARQVIVNKCPYALIDRTGLSIYNFKDCMDFKSNDNDDFCMYTGPCSYIGEATCYHPNPTEVLGYNLTEDEILEFINKKKNGN